jgi:hypothetical protein
MGGASAAFPKSMVWHKFNSCFRWLPISAIIDGRIFCIHGRQESPRDVLAARRLVVVDIDPLELQI